MRKNRKPPTLTSAIEGLGAAAATLPKAGQRAGFWKILADLGKAEARSLSERDSWEEIWWKKGVHVEWREEVRKYVGLCRHHSCLGKHSGVIIRQTTQEMDAAVKEHCSQHPVREGRGRRRGR